MNTEFNISVVKICPYERICLCTFDVPTFIRDVARKENYVVQ